MRSSRPESVCVTKRAARPRDCAKAKPASPPITVNAVAPGPVATELFLNGKTEEQVATFANLPPLQRLGQPDDIAILRRDALQHNIGMKLPLVSIAEAHDAVESGVVTGNVVLSIS